MELQFVFPVEPFLTEGAGEGLLSRVYQHVSAEVVRLFEGSATLPAAVLPLTLRVKLHHRDIPHRDHRGRTVAVQHHRRLWFSRHGKFQFMRSKWLRFYGVSIDMI